MLDHPVTAGLGRRGLVLAINVSPDQAQALSSVLGQEDMAAFTPEDLQSAIEILRQHSVDLVIFGTGPPGIKEKDFCRQLRSNSVIADIPVLLFVSPEAVKVDLSSRLEAGADDYLETDAPPEVLRKKVNRLISERRSRRALREAEARYRSLIESLPAIVYVSEIEAPYRPIYVSPEIESLGYPLDEWRRNPDLWASLLHKEDRVRVMGEPDASAPSPRSTECEYRLTARDGSARWFHDRGRYVKDESGRQICWQGVMIDITQRKQAEETIRTSEERYRDLVEHSQDLICTHDLTGRILSVNRGAARTLGYDESQLVSMNIRDGLPPEVKPQFDEYLETIRREGVASGRMMVIDRYGRRRLWEYRNTLRTEGVDTPIVRGMAHDVTDQWTAERALRKSEERYREIFELGLAGVFVVAADGTFLACNNAFAVMLGLLMPQQALESNLASFLVDPASWEQILSDLKLPKSIQNEEVTLRRADGQTVFAIGNLVAKTDRNGELSEIHGYLFDNTTRKQLEDQLRQSQKMDAVGRLAGGIAHDFNNLLTAVIGYSQLLENKLGPESPLLKELNEIKRAGERAASLTRQLLAFGRKRTMQLKTFNVNSAINDLSKLFRRLISEDIELILRLDPNMGMIRADPGQIEQVIINLVVNAREAMPHGGKLIIATDGLSLAPSDNGEILDLHPGGYVAISISDTGHGMDADTKDHVFEPFFSTKEQRTGVGLGMSIVYGIVKDSGGSIMASSVPGSGATFTIYLPQVEDVPSSTVQGLLTEYKGTETVLIVDDEEAVRGLARDALQAAGYTALEAATVEEALSINDRHEGPIHALLADVIMPQMSGRELMRMLRRVRPEMTVVFMSGYSEASMIRADVAYNNTAFLAKPFAPIELIMKLREALDSSASLGRLDH
jgi:PAS domain S-box-containing protein